MSISAAKKLHKAVQQPSHLDFIDLAAQQATIRPQLDAAIKKVLDQGQYIMGPQIKQFEQQLSAFCGAKHSISCANGTDALALILMAKGVGPGDAVFVPSFTFAATAEVVAWVGATVVFLDCLPDTFNIDPLSLKQGIAKAKKMGLRPTTLISVDLFGQPADYDALIPIVNENGMWLLSDAAQSFGGRYKSQYVGTIGLATATSFFPAKPLGCYGDGGAVFTDDAELASVIESLRVHGKGTDKYDNVRIGMNGRLDTLQAAILIEKLNIFPWEIQERQRVAQRYNQLLSKISGLRVPYVLDDCMSVWAQYTLVLPDHINRDALIQQLKQSGVPTAVYYPKPLHQQTAYKHYPTAAPEGRSLDVCEKLSHSVLSLPMHPYLTNDQIDWICDAFAELVG